MDLRTSGQTADELIAAEVSIQDKMWGVSNERADATENQMLGAACSQLLLVAGREENPEVDEAELLAQIKAHVYPKDWDGLRSYGSAVANLVVAAAYIRSEIKRRLLLGEDTTRTKRGEPYKTATPYMSSDDAA